MNNIKVIITAMKEEADIIIKRFDLKEVKKDSIPDGIRLFEWTRDEDNIILALSGIWKVYSAIASTYLFENYDIDKLVNIWIAWNISDQWVKVWDVFLPNTFIKHDLYLPFDGEHLDYIKKPIFLDYAVWNNFDLNKFWLILNWICLTGSQFIDNEEKRKELRETHSGDIVEMEAFSILSVAKAYRKLDKCVVIKAVSDWADNEAKDSHMDNLEFAMWNSVDVLELVL